MTTMSTTSSGEDHTPAKTDHGRQGLLLNLMAHSWAPAVVLGSSTSLAIPHMNYDPGPVWHA